MDVFEPTQHQESVGESTYTVTSAVKDLLRLPMRDIKHVCCILFVQRLLPDSLLDPM